MKFSKQLAVRAPLLLVFAIALFSSVFAIAKSEPSSSTYVFGIPDREVGVGEMEIAWRVEKERVVFRLRSPAQGWLLVGFSPNGDLVGSHLVFARMQNDRPEVFDHQVLALGDHRPDSSIGGEQDSVALLGKRNSTGTEIVFSVMRGLRSVGPALPIGVDFPLIVAYSTSNDLDHHSRMRRTLPVHFRSSCWN